MRAFVCMTIAAVLLGWAGTAWAQLEDDEQQLRDLEQGCATALMSGDAAWLASFYGKDWVLVGSDNRRYSRKLTLTQIATGQVKWQSIVLSEMNIQVFGDIAIVVYKAAARGTLNGARIGDTEICTDTFLRVDDTWQCVHSHNWLVR